MHDWALHVSAVLVRVCTRGFLWLGQIAAVRLGKPELVKIPASPSAAPAATSPSPPGPTHSTLSARLLSAPYAWDAHFTPRCPMPWYDEPMSPWFKALMGLAASAVTGAVWYAVGRLTAGSARCLSPGESSVAPPPGGAPRPPAPAP